LAPVIHRHEEGSAGMVAKKRPHPDLLSDGTHEMVVLATIKRFPSEGYGFKQTCQGINWESRIKDKPRRLGKRRKKN